MKYTVTLLILRNQNHSQKHLFQICLGISAQCNLARTNEGLSSNFWLTNNMCGTHRDNGNSYDDVMYVSTIGNKGNLQLEVLHTFSDLTDLKISSIEYDRYTWILTHSKILTHQ